MFLDGEDMRQRPLTERKERLKPIMPKNRLLAYSDHRWTHGTRYFKAAERRGLEGIMAKRAQSQYLSGARSADWLKIKTVKRQEVAIVGFTAPRASRQYFGSLVLAVREGAAWRYVGHVGTGFSRTTLAEIHNKLSPLRMRASPFKERVKDESTTTWVKPKLVAEVKFTEWTAAGEMRHPAFVGLRQDKKPQDVVLEEAAQLPSQCPARQQTQVPAITKKTHRLRGGREIGGDSRDGAAAWRREQPH
jgi:bifunctional non-homologous end joining protein LigD